MLLFLLVILLFCFLVFGHPLLYYQNTCFFYTFPFYFIWKFNFFFSISLLLFPHSLVIFLFLSLLFLYFFLSIFPSRLIVNILLSIFTLFLYHFLFKFDILIFSSFIFFLSLSSFMDKSKSNHYAIIPFTPVLATSSTKWNWQPRTFNEWLTGTRNDL